jgi:hypothetical protein
MGDMNRVGIGLSYRPANGYIGWRNLFLEIDSWAPLKLKNIVPVYRKEDGEAEDHILVIDEEENSSSSNNAVSLELFSKCSGSASGTGMFLHLPHPLVTSTDPSPAPDPSLFFIKLLSGPRKWLENKMLIQKFSC